MAIRTHVSPQQCDIWLLTLAGASSLDSAASDHRNALLFSSYSSTANLLLTIKVGPDRQKQSPSSAFDSEDQCTLSKRVAGVPDISHGYTHRLHFLSFRIWTSLAIWSEAERRQGSFQRRMPISLLHMLDLFKQSLYRGMRFYWLRAPDIVWMVP